jgi:hypothetical protein
MLESILKVAVYTQSQRIERIERTHNLSDGCLLNMLENSAYPVTMTMTVTVTTRITKMRNICKGQEVIRLQD